MDSEVLTRIYIKVLNFVSYSPRSQKEIEDRLQKYIYTEQLLPKEEQEVFEYVVSKLKEQGFFNDDKVAVTLVIAFQNSNKPKSNKEIRLKLQRKGLHRESIDNALNALDSNNEFLAAKTIIEKKFKNLPNPKDFAQINKAVKYLAAKGFSFDVARRAVDTMNEVK